MTYQQHLLSIKNGEKPKTGPKPKKPLAKMSAKRKIVQKEYEKLVKEAAAKDNECAVKSPMCTFFMQGLNHKKKRTPNNITDPDNLENCCNACNLYIELNSDWAKQNGHFISKFIKP